MGIVVKIQKSKRLRDISNGIPRINFGGTFSSGQGGGQSHGQQK